LHNWKNTSKYPFAQLVLHNWNEIARGVPFQLCKMVHLNHAGSSGQLCKLNNSGLRMTPRLLRIKEKTLHQTNLSIMGYFSIDDAARKTGISKRTLYYRPDIQEMLASTTPQIAPRGLKLYPTSAFPPDIKVALMDTTHPPLRVPLQGGDLAPRSELPSPHRQLNPAAATEVAARLNILNYRDTWVDAGKYPNQYEADIAFCRAATAGELPKIQPELDQLAWGQYKGLSRATLCRMRKKRNSAQISELSRVVGHRKGDSQIDRDEGLSKFILGQILQFPHQSVADLYVKLQELQLPSIPSLPSVRRWIDRWIADNQGDYLRQTNPDAWRNKIMVGFGSYSQAVYQPNQLWEIDSSPTDTMLQGKRYAEVALIDVYSRRAMVKIFETSKADAIMTLIRLAVIEWGIPTVIKSDQGKDYLSDAVTAFCGKVGIQLQHCQPYSPWQKPHVERLFGSLNHDQADLPGYIGHDVATRQAIRSQHSFADNRSKPNLGAGEKGELSPAQFQSWMDDWVAKYNSRTHESIGKTPTQAFAELDHPNYCQDIQFLNMLTWGHGERKVGKGGIHFRTYKFVADELALWIGKKVLIYSDAADLGRLVVCDLEGTYICDAIEKELAGIALYDIARSAKAKQNAAYVESSKTLRQAKRDAKKLRPNVEAIKAERAPTPIPVKLTPVTPITAKSVERSRLGEDIFALILRAAELGQEIPQDFTTEELRKLRIYLELDAKYCKTRIPMAFETQLEAVRFTKLINEIANPQPLAQ
jgi:transposase InsO family protein